MFLLHKLAVAAVLATSCCASQLRGARSLVTAEPSGLTANDNGILAFALQLECLEANFYGAWLNNTLPAADTASGSGAAAGLVKMTGAPGTGLTPFVTTLANELYANELAHLKLLRGVLKANGPQCASIDISDATFAAILTAAAPANYTGTFSPYADENSFLIAAFIFEDVGVTAYNGAAGLLNSKAILTAAAALHNVEAYHAGVVRSILNERKAVMLDGASIGTIVNAISALRDKLDGNASVQDAGITSASMPLILAPADTNAFVYARTVAQVIDIVTNNGASDKGLFFPEGLIAAVAM